MKRMLTHLRKAASVLLAAAFILTMLSGAAMVQADEIDPDYGEGPVITSGDFGYQMNEDGTVTIAEYTGSEEDLVIPAEIDGYQVSAIGPESFSYQKLKSLIISEGIQEIAGRAFEYCTVTDSFVLPLNATIRYSAFSYAKLPEVMTIPSGAVLAESSFSYCDLLKVLIIEPETVVEDGAFEYCKNLVSVVCAADASLENEAFYSCSRLENVYLCGDVQTDGDPFAFCDNVEIISAEEEDFSRIVDEVLETAEETAGLTRYSVGQMTFMAPITMIRTYSPDYDILLADSAVDYMIGAAEYPPSVLDFENDEDIKTMTATAEDYVAVDSAYKVKICGFPAVWINIHDTVESSIGAYLYISTESHMYYLMYVNIAGSYQEFLDLAASITIEGVKEGTDLSAIAG